MLWTVLSAMGVHFRFFVCLQRLALFEGFEHSADRGRPGAEIVRPTIAVTRRIGPAYAHPDAPIGGAVTIAKADRQRILRQAIAIGLAVTPFGLAFGLATHEAGLGVVEAMGFSTLVFTGSAQFAAVSVLADGGSALTAVVAGALLNLRSLAFGVALAPVLGGSLLFRTAAAQLMIDEAAAVGMAQPSPTERRFGYLAGGISVFVLWNLSTAVGAALLGAADGFVRSAGIDATIPAAFLALLWPRLSDDRQRTIALAGAVIAIAGVPLLPPGLPILVAGLAVLVPTGRVAG